MLLFLKGLALGFSVAAPVGPIGLLCIRRTLAQSARHGFVTGLGAATADALYGLVAGFGLVGVSRAVTGAQVPLRAAGGVFLLFLAWRTATAPVRAAREAEARASLTATYLSALLLTVTNPATILSFAAAFAGLGLTAGAGAIDAASLVSGVFLGSAFWWLLLAGFTGLFRAKLDERWIRRVNIASGVLLAMFGAWALAGLL